MPEPLRAAAVITAGIALGFAGIAAADTVTTSPGVRLLVALAAIASIVLASWGVRRVAGRACSRNPSTSQPAADQSIQVPNRRFRRG